MFDTERMAVRTPEEIEILRRSAAMAPLPHAAVVQILDEYRTAALQLKHVRAILTALGPNWRASRNAFNELVKVTQPG